MGSRGEVAAKRILPSPRRRWRQAAHAFGGFADGRRASLRARAVGVSATPRRRGRSSRNVGASSVTPRRSRRVLREVHLTIPIPLLRHPLEWSTSGFTNQSLEGFFSETRTYAPA